MGNEGVGGGGGGGGGEGFPFHRASPEISDEFFCFFSIRAKNTRQVFSEDIGITSTAAKFKQIFKSFHLQQNLSGYLKHFIYSRISMDI